MKSDAADSSLLNQPTGRFLALKDRKVWLVAALLAVAYAPITWGGYIWDDDQYVTNNLNLRDADGLVRIWTEPRSSPQYYPLVFTTFWIEYHLWGLAPAGYHVVNLLLHAVSAWLLWQILARLDVPLAGVAATIFALHPVHVESVAWITERKNVLSGVLYLSSLYAYLSFSGLPARRGPDRRRWSTYLLVLVLFIAALLSKSVSASLPAAALLLLWWKRDRMGLRDVLPLLPLFLFGLVAGLSTAWLEQEHVGAGKIEWGLSFADRVLIAGRCSWFYLAKLLWPHPLIFTYPRWAVDSSSLLQWLAPVAAIFMVMGLWRYRRRIGKGPLVAALYFAGTLFPVLGFIEFYPMLFSFVADHFQYLASIGPMALAMGCLPKLFPRRKRIHGMIGSGILLVLAALTFQHALNFFDSRTLWNDTLRKNPQAWLAHLNLGVLLERQGETKAALDHLQQAERLAPHKAVARVNLGTALYELGRSDEAIALHRAAIAERPSFWFAYFNLATILKELNRNDEAADCYRKALELKPDSGWAAYHLAEIADDAGRIDEAIGYYNAALSMQSDRVQAHFRLAVLYEQRNDNKSATEHLRRLLQLQPAHPEALALLRKLEAATSRPTP